MSDVGPRNLLRNKSLVGEMLGFDCFKFLWKYIPDGAPAGDLVPGGSLVELLYRTNRVLFIYFLRIGKFKCIYSAPLEVAA